MRKFKTESQKLLDLMINSIYTNREIFLRELISNASDAVDKLYLKSLTCKDAVVDKDSLGIRIVADKEARSITISDSGIGMDKDELDRNLSTIAHSGSEEFKTANAEQQGKEIDIIGQFGVGFYSAFMVAKNVKVISRAYGSDEANVWESNGAEGYTISPAQKDEWGTDVILTLKDDGEDESYSEFLEDYRLRELIKKYSNYVRYPIRLLLSKSRKAEGEEADYEDYKEFETINSMIPIWKRKKSEVEDSEYNEFFKSAFHQYDEPARSISLHAEGSFSYDALLFIPSKMPWDLYTKDFKRGLALYSSGVMIMEKCEELLPECFSFIQGVVDSQDLTLNISRETLQHNNQLKVIARRLEKKIKSELEDMRDNDREAYEAFFAQFGRNLKYGIYSSYGEKKELLEDLLLFHSARQNKLISLADYIETASEDQKSIFYAFGADFDRLSKMPMVASVMDKGYDVLICTQDVDEFCLMALHEYYGKDFRNVSSGDLGIDTEDEKNAADILASENEALLEAIKKHLEGKVQYVEISNRLADAPVGIAAAGPISLEMQRILNTEPGGELDQLKSERVLELNGEHQVFAALQAAQEAGDDEKIASYANILYNQALLIEGLPIEDPIAFSKDIASLMI